ncbi:MAG: hypothetical protein ACOC3Z_01175 [Nanoarchaeota archaeon]
MVKKKETKKKTKKKVTKKKNIKNNKLKKNHIVLVSILILLTLIIVSLSFIYNSQIENNLSNCNKDSDCVKVQTTCCPCNMGGEEVCVPASEKEKYEINKSSCPEDLMCTAMYNCNENPCECNNGNCSFSN